MRYDEDELAYRRERKRQLEADRRHVLQTAGWWVLIIGSCVGVLVWASMVDHGPEVDPNVPRGNEPAVIDTTVGDTTTVELADTLVVRQAVPWKPPWPWIALADCESGDGDGQPPYRASPRFDGYFDGAYQFLPSTWRMAIRLVPGWQPAYAYQASFRLQTRVAMRWLRATSWSQWPTCSVRIGVA